MFIVILYEILKGGEKKNINNKNLSEEIKNNNSINKSVTTVTRAILSGLLEFAVIMK